MRSVYASQRSRGYQWVWLSTTRLIAATISRSPIRLRSRASRLRHVTGDRYERGLDAYASQFGIAREEVPAWFAERFGERFGFEAINAAGGAWPDDCLSLRDRSLIVRAAMITQGGLEARIRPHVRWAIEHGSNR